MNRSESNLDLINTAEFDMPSKIVLRSVAESVIILPSLVVLSDLSLIPMLGYNNCIMLLLITVGFEKIT